MNFLRFYQHLAIFLLYRSFFIPFMSLRIRQSSLVLPIPLKILQCIFLPYFPHKFHTSSSRMLILHFLTSTFSTPTQFWSCSKSSPIIAPKTHRYAKLQIPQKKSIAKSHKYQLNKPLFYNYQLNNPFFYPYPPLRVPSATACRRLCVGHIRNIFQQPRPPRAFRFVPTAHQAEPPNPHQ